ncbi:MAG: insulinase family protein [Christensenellaceae bacterium]|nr:insulinase family protein [Christensenellaceae bacterium]
MAKIVKNYPSGLRLIVDEMQNFKSVSTAITIMVGSSDERPNEHGLSHFCEHMLFKGTKKRSGTEIINQLSFLGVDYNAWTGENCTCYHTKGIADNVETTVEILADMYFNLKFNEDDFYKEGDVIVQEIAMHEDNPRSVLFELANSTFFYGTKYQHPIAGTAKDVKSFQPKDVYNYIKKHYIASKTVLSFAGDITLEKAEKLVEKYFTPNFTEFTKPQVLEITDEVLLPKSKEVKKNKKTEQQHVMLSFPVCNQFGHERYALRFLNSIFSGDMSSRLFMNVRERLGLVYTIHGGMELTDIGGYYYIFFSCTPQNTKKVIETIKIEIDKLLKNGITEDELEKTKNQKQTDLLFETENGEAVNSINVDQLIKFNKILPFEERLKIYKDMKVADIDGVARKYLDMNKVIISVVGK